MRVTNIDNSPSFSAKPNNMKSYTRTINKGLSVLDKKLGLIIHNSSVPSAPKQNPGIGSLLSVNTEAAFVPFLRQHGVTTIQQEPNFLRRLNDPSPYSPISTSKNIYSIPLERLATEDYDYLIPESTLARVIDKNHTQNEENVNYSSVIQDYSSVLKEAYDNFTSRMKNGMSDETLALALDFSHFRKTHSEELTPNAIYESLAKKYNNEDWRNWEEKDRNLYDSQTETPYLKQLKEEYKHDIDFHIFKQWILDRETSRINKINQERGIKIIADTPVAFTPAEVWLNKDLFMEDFTLGCPPDCYAPEGQRWSFPFLKPDSIFNEDGSLGKGGEFLKKRYESIFKDAPGGVRIDHVIGLIDPFVYNDKEPHMNEFNSGRIYSSPEKEIFKDYTKKEVSEYAALLEKIVFPAAEKYGITKDSIICEDLGAVTGPVEAVMKKLALPGITLSQFMASTIHAPEQNVIMPGSHDNSSFIEFTDSFFNNAKNSTDAHNHFIYRTHILASDTLSPRQDENQYREEIRNDKKKFIGASFASLFVSPAKKMQFFFTDFFGIAKTYNVPGTQDGCWTLRLGSDFEKLYYDNLAQGYGLNIPEAIAIAIRKRGNEFAHQYKKLLQKLDNFAKILKS